MYRLMGLILVTIILLGLLPQNNTQSAQEDTGYTIAEVIAAYEGGQFRVIYTRGVFLHSSPNGTYISVYDDGLYRVNDGAFFEQFDIAIFSHDERYLAQNRDGIYRASDFELIIPIVPEEIWINNGDHVIVTGSTDFSPDGEYVSVTGAGVYRLSDGAKIIQTDSLEINFSPDSNYIATQEGVYRLSDGAKLFDMYGYYPNFSYDSAYAYAWTDGVYRISDGERLFDISSAVSFTPDMEYAVALGNGVYHLSDGERLYDVEEGGAWPAYSPDGQYMAITNDGIYHIASGERLFAIQSSAIFSPDGRFVAASRDGVYRLSDGQQLFSISGVVQNFSEDGTLLIVSGLTFGGGGIYRISDGHNLIPAPYGAVISHDGHYVAVGTVGLFRLSDGQQLFDIESSVIEFTPNDDYIMASGTVYRVSDGRYYPGLRLLNVSAGVMAIGNAILIVDPTQHIQSIPFIRTDSGNHTLFLEPNFESESLRHINGGSYLAVLDERGDWYQVGYLGLIGWVPSERAIRFEVPDFRP